jgi:RNA polymerase sigma-70 factor (ECF subfamily)
MEPSAARRSHDRLSPALTAIAANVKARLSEGDIEGARALYDELVVLLQRRAARLAFYYLRDGAEADEAAQDAFVRAFTHLDTFNEQLSFDVWFTRILVNACLDRVKARTRRMRWFVPLSDGIDAPPPPPSPAESPESALLRNERAGVLRAAIDRLPERQRLVVLLSHLDGRSTREVSELTGLSESTVRVHLFRAIRKLRSALTTPARI